MSVVEEQVRAAAPAVAPSQRIEELGRIILAYSEITEKLQASHDQLTRTVVALKQELSEKSRQLERKNRLAALGEMAAGMAHEIRNPLGGIQLYASMLARDVSDRPDSLVLVQKISGGVKRLEGLVSQVLQFTREIRAHVAVCDLAEVVEQAVELARRDGGAEIVVDGPRPFPVVVDPLLIGQCVLNLVLNGIEAMDGTGRVSVSYAAPAGEEARQFRMVVQDAGPGIPAGAMDKIFNPFFTTKDNGTGLGLAIVHRIVEAHDGTITVTNPPDGGARFEIRV
jgi:two-component system sensor histidine kinase HydH